MKPERWTKNGAAVAVVECDDNGTVQVAHEVFVALLIEAGYLHGDTKPGRRIDKPTLKKLRALADEEVILCPD